MLLLHAAALILVLLWDSSGDTLQNTMTHEISLAELAVCVCVCGACVVSMCVSQWNCKKLCLLRKKSAFTILCSHLVVAFIQGNLKVGHTRKHFGDHPEPRSLASNSDAEGILPFGVTIWHHGNDVSYQACCHDNCLVTAVGTSQFVGFRLKDDWVGVSQHVICFMPVLCQLMKERNQSHFSVSALH